MELLEENEEKIVNMKFDMTEKEQAMLLLYAGEKMTIEKLNELKIEWVINDILKHAVENAKREGVEDE